MKHCDTFSSFHPIINFLFFAQVIGFSMFFTHPVCLLISFAAALSYTVYLKGQQAMGLIAAFVPMMVFATAVGVLFNHEGATILAYFPSGNPLTLESIAASAASAVMLCAVLLWFVCLSQVFTSDKFVYLFGRVIPALSLVLSMTLRFVPLFGRRFSMVRDGQRCLGKNPKKLSCALSALSIVVTWSLENAIETADSMKSRGYGLPGRTAFSNYRFDTRDRHGLVWLLLCLFYILCGAAAGGLSWQFYPMMSGCPVGVLPVSFFVTYLALCMTPVVVGRWEDRKWKHLNFGT